MIRILRAFAWMRWRIFINSLEKTGARDVVERFSLAIEHIAPILLTVVMVPSALGLAALAGYAGHQIAIGSGSAIPLQVIRYLILAATFASIVGPMILPAADRTNPVRLLLLPISRRTLYVAQTAATLTDPWIMLLLPIVLSLPVGMLIGGAPVAASIALAAGIMVLLAIIAVSALTTTLIHLLLRDRRRGELIALAFVLILPVISFLPATLGSQGRRERRRDRETSQREHTPAERRPAVPSWLSASASRAFSLTPSELYTSSVKRAAAGQSAGAAASASALAAATLALHAIGLLLFGRVLAAPLASGPRRTASASGLWQRIIPGLSPGASAVALTQVRLALRTPRGRATLFSPLLMLVFFGLLVLRSGNMSFGPFGAVDGGLGLATFASSVALLSILPIAMNQFAVDGAGMTMALLSPLTTRQLLSGKAVGNGLIAIPTALLCVAIAAAVFGGDSVATWLALPLGLIATYTLASPAAAVFSAVLPRVVDMNSIGRGSNAHGLSGLLGLLAFGVSAVPCIALAYGAPRLLGWTFAGPVLLLVWCAISFVIARVLLGFAARVFDRRRENLVMLM
jgi:hypothetical protein